MDTNITKEFVDAGLDLEDGGAAMYVPAQLLDGEALAIGADVPVAWRDRTTVVALPPISELFSGDQPAPDMTDDLEDEYVPFFATIELTAIRYCEVVGKRTPDREFERLYRLLLRQPDGHDANPLFSHLQAAVRLYMSIADVSKDEFEAVIFRLVRSVKRFSDGRLSANYVRFVGEQLALLG